MLYEIFVDDKDYDSEDGYTLYTYDAYKVGIMVEMALKNGFEDIRIGKARLEEKLDYDKRAAVQYREERENV